MVAVVRATVLSLALVVTVVSASALAAGGPRPGIDFPLGPRIETTPGETCQHPDSYRYPEHIAYCDRAVLTQDKVALIAMYDAKFGYHIEQMNRQDFKIDHFIPLCAGGGNDQTNLWPQNVAVYTITDPLEPLICEKMSEGKLRQIDAIALIREGKNDLSKVKGILDQLNAM